MNSPYVRKAPSPQQTVDLFAGKWASKLPEPFAAIESGTNLLFQDPKVAWARDKLAELGVAIKGSSIVELGPLEGAHTYLLAKEGAASVTAVEGHGEAYLKCLVVKELLGIERVNFLLGDAIEFLKGIHHTYDIGFASGFLYHMENPVELIELLCRRCNAVYLWTVFRDEAFSRKHPEVLAGSGPVTKREHMGFPHALYRHSYGSGLDYGKFWGGPADHSNWMGRDDILGAFGHFGFTRQVWEVTENPNGAALSLAAVRG